MGIKKSNALAMMTMLAMVNDGFRHDIIEDERKGIKIEADKQKRTVK